MLFSLFHSHCGREREIFRASMAAGNLMDLAPCPMSKIVLSNPLMCKSWVDQLIFIFLRLCAKDQRPGGWFGILAKRRFNFRFRKRWRNSEWNVSTAHFFGEKVVSWVEKTNFDHSKNSELKHVGTIHPIHWVVPPPSNSGKWRFIGIPY